MAKKHTKEQLLATVADDNEFIDKYLMIINANEDVPVDKKSNKGTGRQIHHIIPRLYFRKNKKVVDDSETNLISLTLGEHFLAHYYLWRGCKQEYKGKCACAVHFMIKCHEREIFKGFTHDEEAAKLFAQALNDDSIEEDRVEAMSEAMKGEKNPMYGKPGTFTGRKHSKETKSKQRKSKLGDKNPAKRKEVREKISNTLKGKFAGEKCYMYGKPKSEEIRKKISDTISGSHWYNNGVTEIQAHECPEGFIRGRLKKS